MNLEDLGQKLSDMITAEVELGEVDPERVLEVSFTVPSGVTVKDLEETYVQPTFQALADQFNRFDKVLVQALPIDNGDVFFSRVVIEGDIPVRLTLNRTTDGVKLTFDILMEPLVC